MSATRRFEGRRVLGVFPHPDDESWIAGGLLRRAVDEGAVVRVLTLTRGDGGQDRVSGRRGVALAEAREGELRAACAALGVDDVVIGALPDGGVRVGEAFALIARHVAELAPDIVVGFDEDGGYGHVDHVAAARAMLAAARGCVLGAVFARGLLEGVRNRLLARPGLIDAACARGALGGGRVDVEIALTDAEAAAKRAALSAHASQVAGRGLEGFLAPGVFAAGAAVERFRLMAGSLPWS